MSKRHCFRRRLLLLPDRKPHLYLTDFLLLYYLLCYCMFRLLLLPGFLLQKNCLLPQIPVHYPLRLRSHLPAVILPDIRSVPVPRLNSHPFVPVLLQNHLLLLECRLQILIRPRHRLSLPEFPVFLLMNHPLLHPGSVLLLKLLCSALSPLL